MSKCGAPCEKPALEVHVVDDDADVRDALGLLLGLRGYKVRLFDCAEAFLATLKPQTAGCLITDIRMPGMNGLQLQRVLNEREARLPVVVLTAHGDIDSARTALRAQAVDFLLKPFKEADLIAAIELSFAREREHMTALDRRSADESAVAALTAREREVAALLSTGAQNLEIAQRLGISPRTVEIHKARCMEKLKVRTIADLVRLADRVGLQPQP